MPRSPLTLAASVTAALPGANVVSARGLGSSDGRIASAVADLDDGSRVVVRVGGDDEPGRALVAEARVLGALSAGVRSLLPFRAPQLLGEVGVAGGGRAVVADFLDGYRVDAADVPAGPGFATLLGTAIAAVHDLPVTVIRAEGFPVRSSDQVQAETARLLERASATGRVPQTLRDRWRHAVEDDSLWRFESTVVLGGVEAGSFVFADQGEDAIPTVVGLLDWSGLSIGDPAVDLRWVANAPLAAEDVHEAYVAASHRSADAHLMARARLLAELEFAKWLVHGHDEQDETIMQDAERLLASLADATADTDLVRPDGPDVDDAIALLDRVPAAADTGIDTSMHTDAYDPAELGAYLDDAARTDRGDDDAESIPTLPVDLSEWTVTPDLAPREKAAAETSPATEAPSTAAAEPATLDESDDHAEAARASRAALRRWSQS
ncbi:phosphotransferase [Microbacterium sp. cx-55]|uniref:phosphotransferase n=1 Tax=unclassified Microbacterium TaxID=2609290 RepID=UPI001CBFBEF4|nr:MULTISPECIES: phosphotransferase [unclassified Microbacterium]MBZ4485920.1 phosphotransferase [Microbacterium sp. cx-55]MCC4906881.1 phosphotransferase [Microbacterium sp. cx-59]UGB34204.1 phosphotransferase [Microbacterium sp. cx-55]